jgi:hypothetical protein
LQSAGTVVIGGVTVPIPTSAVDVTRPEQWAEVLAALTPVQEVAVDVEADSMHHFHARLCFVQLGTDEHIFLADTLSEGVTIKALEAMFADPKATCSTSPRRACACAGCSTPIARRRCSPGRRTGSPTS